MSMNINNLLSSIPPINEGNTKQVKIAYEKSKIIVQIYYICLFFICIHHLFSDYTFLFEKTFGNIVWSVLWISEFEKIFTIPLFFLILILGSFFSALFPQNRWTRIFTFIGFFQYVALLNSFGKVNHSLHGWVLTSFVFIFLPFIDIHFKKKHSVYMKYLTVFWGAQAIFLLTYTLAGVMKIQGIIFQITHQQIHALSPNALAIQIANTLISSGYTSLLGSFFVQYPLLGWPLYIGTIVLETVSIIIAYIPSLHRIWAVALILMHIGIFLTMNIGFSQNILLLAVLFFYSPFAPPHQKFLQNISRYLRSYNL